jgi:hypothetical protein
VRVWDGWLMLGLVVPVEAWGDGIKGSRYMVEVWRSGVGGWGWSVEGG